MNHKTSYDVDQALVMIRRAITSGRAETVIPLIDDVREYLAKSTGMARIRSVERFIWAKLPDARVGSSQMGKRVVFCARTKDWRVSAGVDATGLTREPFDPDFIASIIVEEMRKALSS